MSFSFAHALTASLLISASALANHHQPANDLSSLKLSENSHVGFIGGGLGSRMNIFNEFETELQRRHPELNLYIRNFCKEGDTPGFRPHPSRKNFYAFPGAKELVPVEFQTGGGEGHFSSPDQWLTDHKIDTVIGFFGYSSSFGGAESLDRYKKEFSAFIDHTLKQNYNSQNAPQLAIVSPAAFEDLSDKRDLPDGIEHNANIELYTNAMAEICQQKGILFIDAFTTTKELYASHSEALTSNGHNLTQKGYQLLSPILADGLFGKKSPSNDYQTVKAAVAEKNRLWLLDYKIPNGVHVHGRRHRPYGADNYPEELQKTREMTAIRDNAIWAINHGNTYDITAADAKTTKLAPTKTNFKTGAKKMGQLEYYSGEDAISKIKMAPGYKLQLFADEKMFPNLANPSQMAFDNQGRLWVGCMGSYPHYRIGDPLPNDKILIFEDTDGDGVADKETIFVDHIHIPMGFEITEQGGAFVSLGNDLVHLMDTDGDSKADKKELVLSGFDDHDTHHAISSFCADPSGAIYMGEGVFSHSNVETPYGVVRGSNGGFYRFNPTKGKLERTAQYVIPNPWGIAFDEWGQNFFLFTSGPMVSWMQEAAVKNRYNVNIKPTNIISTNGVRPTSGIEFISSRHFPDDVQGDMLICNNISFHGAKQHSISEDKTNGGFQLTWEKDLFESSYANFRPVDLEFAPDGSLYFLDWQNALIGHMQHSARDPHRDHVHGRIYRVTYPSRPLVKPANIAGAPIEELLENLKLPEYRTRYRTRRELRGRNANEVTTALAKWISTLDKNDSQYEHNLTEAMWVSWGINQIDTQLVTTLLSSDEPKAQAAAIRAIQYNIDAFPNAKELLTKAAGDAHWLVRHEAAVSSSWLGEDIATTVITEAKKQPIKQISLNAFNYGLAHAKGEAYSVKEDKKKLPVPKGLPKNFQESYRRGAELYSHLENCASCHGQKGEGLHPINPPLAGSEWVTGDKELLAKIALNGLLGEIKVKGQTYNGAMPGFAYRTSNKDIADMLTYVRNAFGNKPTSGKRDGYTEKEIEKLLKRTEAKKDMYQVQDLAKKHKVKQ